MEKNNSFVQTSNKLKKLGVKNHSFMLATFDRDLKDVDPLNVDPDDTVTQILVNREIRQNPWYFFREIVRVQNLGKGTFDLPFKLHLGNLAELYLMLNGYDAHISMPRQCYGKTSAFCFYAYKMVTDENFAARVYEPKYPVCCGYIGHILNIYNALPEYIRKQSSYGIIPERKIANKLVNQNDPNKYIVGIYRDPDLVRGFDLKPGIHLDAEFGPVKSFKYVRRLREMKQASIVDNPQIMFTKGITDSLKFFAEFADIEYINWEHGYYDLTPKYLRNMIGSKVVRSISSYIDCNMGDTYYNLMKNALANDKSFKREILLNETR